MPFDQFTIEQIAGDLLPNATIEQKIATGFHRNTMINEEGGVDPEESRYEVVVDRANTTATVWLGRTLGCAQCHNHKYDPFTQKDYYRLLVVLRQQRLRGRSFGDGTRYFEPALELATPEQEGARKELQANVERLDQQLKTVHPRAGRRAENLGGVAARVAGRVDSRHAGIRERDQRRHASRRCPTAPCSHPASTPQRRPTPFSRRVPLARHHRRPHRGAAGRLAAARRPGARRVRPLPCDRHPRGGRIRAGADVGAGRVPHRESRRFGDAVRSGGAARRQARDLRTERRIVGDQRHARHGGTPAAQRRPRHDRAAGGARRRRAERRASIISTAPSVRASAGSGSG